MANPSTADVRRQLQGVGDRQTTITARDQQRGDAAVARVDPGRPVEPKGGR